MVQNNFSSLSLKYKARQFKDIYGNEKTVKDLLNRSKNNTYPKVVMFLGKSGSGKSITANIYVKSMLCENKVDGDVCNECKYCKIVDSGQNTDYLYFYNGGSFGTEEADILIKNADTHILGNSTKKIFVIDEVQSIKSKAAEEKLLKILERENDDCYFVLGAMRWEKLEVASKRRSTRYFMKNTFEEIGGFLTDVASKEGLELNDDLLNILVTIAENCNNSIGEALPLLERVIFSEIKTEKDLTEELNLVSSKTLNDIIDGLLKGDSIILNNTISEDMIKTMYWKLVLLYKHAVGVKLNTWESSQLIGIDKYEISKIQNVIKELNELKNYKYIDVPLIEYTFINILQKNKSITNENKDVPRRRRQLNG